MRTLDDHFWIQDRGALATDAMLSGILVTGVLYSLCQVAERVALFPFERRSRCCGCTDKRMRYSKLKFETRFFFRT